jgi:hypothetical protein
MFWRGRAVVLASTGPRWTRANVSICLTDMYPNPEAAGIFERL